MTWNIFRVLTKWMLNMYSRPTASWRPLDCQKSHALMGDTSPRNTTRTPANTSPLAIFLLLGLPRMMTKSQSKLQPRMKPSYRSLGTMWEWQTPSCGCCLYQDFGLWSRLLSRDNQWVSIYQASLYVNKTVHWNHLSEELINKCVFTRCNVKFCSQAGFEGNKSSLCGSLLEEGVYSRWDA